MENPVKTKRIKLVGANRSCVTTSMQDITLKNLKALPSIWVCNNLETGENDARIRLGGEEKYIIRIYRKNSLLDGDCFNVKTLKEVKEVVKKYVFGK